MKKILIIEDDLFIRENIYEVLELSGYKAYATSNGKDGLALALQISPDLIICDIMMPLMDGFKVKEYLSENSATKNIPFIFLTAKTELKELRFGMTLGADDYITKPFEIKDLLNSIQIRFEKLENMKRMFNVAANASGQPKNKILLQNSGKTELVPYNEIVFIRSIGNYTEIFLTSEHKLIIRKNLKYWQTHLPGGMFLRTHKSFIININHLENVEKISVRSYKLKMKFYSKSISASPKHISKLKDFFS